MNKAETQPVQAVLELPEELYQRLASLAASEQISVQALLERLVAAYRPLRRPGNPAQATGTLLGEAVAHEEIHVWDRSHDDFLQTYVGDLSD